MTAAPQAPRPLTPTERGLLDALLSHDFPGAGELRTQIARTTATSGCTCGCGTVDLQVADEATAASVGGVAPVEGTVLDTDGAPVGGVLLFAEAGRLSRLEVYSYGDPIPLPAAEQVTWRPTAWARADTERPARFRRDRRS